MRVPCRKDLGKRRARRHWTQDDARQPGGSVCAPARFAWVATATLSFGVHCVPPRDAPICLPPDVLGQSRLVDFAPIRSPLAATGPHDVT